MREFCPVNDEECPYNKDGVCECEEPMYECDDYMNYVDGWDDEEEQRWWVD